MSMEIELVVRQLFEGFDSLDFDAIRGQLTHDAQGVDEIARRWLRGSDDIAKYFVELGSALSEVRSELKDFHAVTSRDSALATLWLEQNYVLNGQAQHVSAPTTIALRREGGSWKVALIHSIPLPAED